MLKFIVQGAVCDAMSEWRYQLVWICGTKWTAERDRSDGISGVGTRIEVV